MRKIVFQVFNQTFGKFIRLIQRSLIPDSTIDSLITVVTKNSIQKSAQFAQTEFTSAVIFADRKNLWLHCIENSNLLSSNQESLVLEFGVWKGESINFLARAIPQCKVFGFDSFQGLEENWYGYTLAKNAFNMNGKLPKVRKNVELIPGWYENTLCNFVKMHSNLPISLLHLDSDTYSPTKYVLTTLKNQLSRGSIIVFDEFFGYPNWELHEYKAWTEFVDENSVNFKYLGYTNMQVAVEIL
jgi:hypothetical protein